MGSTGTFGRLAATLVVVGAAIDLDATLSELEAARAYDATIQMSLDVGDQALAGGRIRRITPDGEVRIIDGDGTFRPRRGNPTNLFDDIRPNIGVLDRAGELDRVTLVDAASNTVLAMYERAGTTWTRVR